MDQKKIGAFIANERKARNITQEQFADLLCVSPKTISKWENGRSLPDIDTMIDICAILEISINEFLSGERLDTKQYVVQAEQNMTVLLKQSNKEYSIGIRKKVYFVTSSMQTIFATLAIIFIMIFLSMTGPNHAPLLAIIFTIAYVVVFVAQLIAVAIIRQKISHKLPLDNLFLMISILFLPVCAAICAFCVTVGM